METTEKSFVDDITNQTAQQETNKESNDNNYKDSFSDISMPKQNIPGPLLPVIFPESFENVAPKNEKCEVSNFKKPEVEKGVERLINEIFHEISDIDDIESIIPTNCILRTDKNGNEYNANTTTEDDLGFIVVSQNMNNKEMEFYEKLEKDNEESEEEADMEKNKQSKEMLPADNENSTVKNMETLVTSTTFEEEEEESDADEDEIMDDKIEIKAAAAASLQNLKLNLNQPKEGKSAVELMLTEFILKNGSIPDLTQEKPYGCPVDGCKKRFKHISGLRYHARNPYKFRFGIAYKCEECSRCFTSRSGLRNHYKKSHPDEIAM